MLVGAEINAIIFWPPHMVSGIQSSLNHMEDGIHNDTHTILKGVTASVVYYM